MSISRAIFTRRSSGSASRTRMRNGPVRTTGTTGAFTCAKVCAGSAARSAAERADVLLPAYDDRVEEVRGAGGVPPLLDVHRGDGDRHGGVVPVVSRAGDDAWSDDELDVFRCGAGCRRPVHSRDGDTA